MIEKMFTESELDVLIDKFKSNAEKRILQLLRDAGEKFIEIARTHGGYNDQTGNLRSSIGYAIVRNGSFVEEDFQITGGGSNPNKGVNKARQLAKKVAVGTNGYALIGVAGMDYAAAVESMGKDVITGSSQDAEKYLKKAIFETFKVFE